MRKVTLERVLNTIFTGSKYNPYAVKLRLDENKTIILAIFKIFCNLCHWQDKMSLMSGTIRVCEYMRFISDRILLLLSTLNIKLLLVKLLNCIVLKSY